MGVKCIKQVAVILIVFAAQISAVRADDVKPYGSPEDIPAALVSSLMRANYQEEYVSTILSMVRRNAENKTSLEQSDIERIKQNKWISSRLNQVQKYLKYDGNFDGDVTREEIEAYLARSSKSVHDQYISNLMVIDSNKDDIVTKQEMLDSADKTLNNPNAHHNTDLEDLLALDPNQDGALSVDELKIIALKSFRTIDSNHDGILSKDEQDSVRAAYNKIQRLQRLMRYGCVPPKAQSNEQIVYISANAGKATSSVSVAGAFNSTTVIPVTIGDGDKDLYIVSYAASPIIWQFNGQTDRIARLILAGQRNVDGQQELNVGAVGVDAKKVTFLEASKCGLRMASYRKEATLESLNMLFGRMVDLYYSDNSPIGLHIFGDRINTDIAKDIEQAQARTPKGFEEKLWQKHIQYMPGGLISIKPEKVVSQATITPYKVYPGWAGYSKLAHDGAIVLEKDDDSSSVTIARPGRDALTIENFEKIQLSNLKQRVEFGSSKLKIVKNIPHYPAGPILGPLKTIIIGKGVDVPKGKPGHSKVIMEETGEAVE